MQYLIPDYIKIVLIALKDSGFKAYIIGGAVRDMMLARIPTDYDIITNALPESVKKIALINNWQTTDDFGELYGVTTFLVNNKKLQITTFRQEIYKDHPHKPERVIFIDDLIPDLTRRDFTINAIALDIEGNVYDQFDGIKDIKKKILKTIGEPKQRFEQDALRMFRACRLCAQLGFVPDKKLYKAMLLHYPKAHKLSVELIKKELEKTFLSSNANLGIRMIYKSGILNNLFAELQSVDKKILKKIDFSYCDLAKCWAKLFLHTNTSEQRVLDNFNYSKKFINKVCDIVKMQRALDR